MNCNDCLAQIDDCFNENSNFVESAAVKAHLEKCSSCAVYYQGLIVILDCCDEVQQHLEVPPNSQALWLRISNIIECEQTIHAAEAKTAAVGAGHNVNWWTRAMNLNLRLSLQQMVSAVFGVAAITSLLTVLTLQNNFSESETTAVRSNMFSSLGGSNGKNQFATRSNLELENNLKQQQLAIDYWNRRVENRKTQWNRNLRDAFDRNLNVIDQVVADYQEQLRSNPNDNISEEMLNSALNDKMELLREFSEL